MANRTVQVDVELVRPFLEKRLAVLEAEAAKLRKVLGGRAKPARALKRRKRKGMTAAQKAEVSRRMKKYWKQRRAAAGKAKS